MAYNEKQLLDLKKRVEEAKTTVSELTGHKQALVKQLQTEWDCKTIEEAEKKLSTMEKEVQKIDLQIKQGIQELESNYNINSL